MNKYEVINRINEGAYGIVLKCRNKETGEIVAIKKFKESEDDEVVRKTTTREVKILRALRSMPSIVHLREAFRRKGRLYLVFEYVGCNLLELLEENPAGLPSELVRRYSYMLVQAIHACHVASIIHRDIKPENLLINSFEQTLKLCDFGFARYMAERPADGSDPEYTDYVATRWYRSPELLLGSTFYSEKVDIWAIGCIMSEMIDGQALFPGESEVDQLFLVQKMLGNYDREHVSMFYENPRFAGYSLPNVARPETLEKRYLGKASKKTVVFLKRLLRLYPQRRIDTTEAVNDVIFDGIDISTPIPVAYRTRHDGRASAGSGDGRRPFAASSFAPGGGGSGFAAALSSLVKPAPFHEGWREEPEAEQPPRAGTPPPQRPADREALRDRERPPSGSERPPSAARISSANTVLRQRSVQAAVASAVALAAAALPRPPSSRPLEKVAAPPPIASAAAPPGPPIAGLASDSGGFWRWRDGGVSDRLSGFQGSLPFASGRGTIATTSSPRTGAPPSPQSTVGQGRGSVVLGQRQPPPQRHSSAGAKQLQRQSTAAAAAAASTSSSSSVARVTDSDSRPRLPAGGVVVPAPSLDGPEAGVILRSPARQAAHRQETGDAHQSKARKEHDSSAKQPPPQRPAPEDPCEKPALSDSVDAPPAAAAPRVPPAGARSGGCGPPAPATAEAPAPIRRHKTTAQAAADPETDGDAAVPLTTCARSAAARRTVSAAAPPPPPPPPVPSDVHERKQVQRTRRRHSYGDEDDGFADVDDFVTPGFNEHHGGLTFADGKGHFDTFINTASSGRRAKQLPKLPHELRVASGSGGGDLPVTPHVINMNVSLNIGGINIHHHGAHRSSGGSGRSRDAGLPHFGWPSGGSAYRSPAGAGTRGVAQQPRQPREDSGGQPAGGARPRPPRLP